MFYCNKSNLVEDVVGTSWQKNYATVANQPRSKNYVLLQQKGVSVVSKKVYPMMQIHEKYGAKPYNGFKILCMMQNPQTTAAKSSKNSQRLCSNTTPVRSTVAH
jgi:hypothetical protein